MVLKIGPQTIIQELLAVIDPLSNLVIDPFVPIIDLMHNLVIGWMFWKNKEMIILQKELDPTHVIDPGIVVVLHHQMSKKDYVPQNYVPQSVTDWIQN